MNTQCWNKNTERIKGTVGWHTLHFVNKTQGATVWQFWENDERWAFNTNAMRG